jgi:hypothetical protein
MRFGGSVPGAEGRHDGAPNPVIPAAKPFADQGEGSDELHDGGSARLERDPVSPLGAREKASAWFVADHFRVHGAGVDNRLRQTAFQTTVPPSASAAADGGELLGQAAAESRHVCEEA